MNRLSKIFVLLFIFYSGLTYSQNEFSKWYFGTNAGLDFSTSPPTVLTNGNANANEGCATISDNSGNLLFYTNGVTVRNSQHNIMANGNGLIGDGSSTQSSIIVKQPLSNSIYYIFTTAGTYTAAYSIVDMSLAAGLGSVTVKNAPLYTPTCEKQVAVQHCNGRDIWIVSHEYQTNKFRAYLLTSSGLNLSPSVSSSGVNINDGSATAGQLKVSPDGKKLAMATSINSASTFSNNFGFHLFDFDFVTGMVSNSFTLINTPLCAYGVEFSPDGTKLFGVSGFSTPNQNLYQWNICAPSNSAIIASQYSLNIPQPATGFLIGGSLQRAIDGKIYWVNYSTTNSPNQNLAVINNPNASGSAINFSLSAISYTTYNPGLDFPNYINSYTKPTPAIFTNTVVCQQVSFSVPPSPTFSNNCSSTPYAPNGYVWDFGDPTTGTANSSTLSNPSHIYSSTGMFTVSLVLLNPCVNDTLKKFVTITLPGPTPAIAGPTTICKGDKYTYTVTGGSTYNWFNNTTASTLTLAPASNTVYSVSATNNGCTLSKTFSVTVSPCTGVAAHSPDGLSLQVFPNPFNDALKIEASEACTIIITDLNGSIVNESALKAGSNELNTAQLKAGIYFVKAKGVSGIWYSRIIKAE